MHHLKLAIFLAVYMLSNQAMAEEFDSNGSVEITMEEEAAAPSDTTSEEAELNKAAKVDAKKKPELIKKESRKTREARVRLRDQTKGILDRDRREKRQPRLESRTDKRGTRLETALKRRGELRDSPNNSPLLNGTPEKEDLEETAL